MTLEESIAENLVKIDVILSAQETPLRMRPFSAATIFVEHCIVEISGDVKTDYAVKPWFAIIYHHIDQWYRDHYGAAFNAKTDSIAIGLVLVRDIPVEIQVPLTTSRVEVPGETAWIKFPIEVDPDEAPLSWLVSPPNLVRLSDGEHAQLTSDATSVAKALRSIKVNFMGIEPADETVNGLLEGVMPELETAALVPFGRFKWRWSERSRRSHSISPAHSGKSIICSSCSTTWRPTASRLIACS